MRSPIIINEDIQLDDISIDDTKRLQILANDSIFRKNTGDNMNYPYTHEDAKSWISYCNNIQGSEHEQQYAIRINNLYAGNIGWNKKKQSRYSDTITFGYRLGKEYRGKGYGTLIVQGFSDFLFKNLSGLHRIEANVYDRNIPSRKVLEKCGFVLEGILKENIFIDNAYHDSRIFGKLNPYH